MLFAIAGLKSAGLHGLEQGWKTGETAPCYHPALGLFPRRALPRTGDAA